MRNALVGVSQSGNVSHLSLDYPQLAQRPKFSTHFKFQGQTTFDARLEHLEEYVVSYFMGRDVK